jgi:hypothetical protein
MMTPHQTFADAVGRASIAEAAGVGLTAVSNAVVRERFPASWFLISQRLAEAKGIECPPELFGMKLPDGSPALNNEDGGAETVSQVGKTTPGDAA